MKRILLAFLSTLVWIPSQEVLSKEIHLICTGKFEINRGKLIEPDWDKTYLSINPNGIMSKINNGAFTKEGRTLKRRGYYYITNRDKNRKVKAKYSVNKRVGTYSVEYPQKNKILIGTCEKGKG